MLWPKGKPWHDPPATKETIGSSGSDYPDDDDDEFRSRDHMRRIIIELNSMTEAMEGYQDLKQRPILGDHIKLLYHGLGELSLAWIFFQPPANEIWSSKVKEDDDDDEIERLNEYRDISAKTAVVIYKLRGIQERKNEKEFNQQLANSSMEFKCRSEISGNYNSTAAYLGYVCLEEETKRK
uniref:Uncharacterized protein n=1 Tax=Linum usitatissimum TaxID=4006 RepID=A0A172MLC3_LINUS|nr:hypothetical protein [Linum usitatissimum]